MAPRVAVVLTLPALLLAGCGDSDSDEGASKPARTESAKAEKPKVKAKPASAEECLKGLGFQVERRDSNLVRATPEGSRGFININEFPSAAEAKKFEAQLEVPVPHFHAGRKVGVGFAGSEASDVHSVERCVRAEQQN